MNRFTFALVLSLSILLQSCERTKERPKLEPVQNTHFDYLTLGGLMTKTLQFEAYTASLVYSTEGDYNDNLCYKNKSLSLNVRASCYSRFLRFLAYEYSFDHLVSTRDVLQDFESTPWYNEFKGIIDSTSQHLRAVDSISVLPIPEDAKAYMRALSLKGIARALVFYHGTCSRYTNQLTGKPMREFLESFPNSPYVDDAVFWLVSNGESPYLTKEQEGMSYDLVEQSLLFIKHYPASEFVDEAYWNILLIDGGEHDISTPLYRQQEQAAASALVKLLPENHPSMDFLQKILDKGVR